MNITLDENTYLAPIKLNLYLHITARRDSGYHEVDTLIAFTDYGDAVRVEPSDKLEMAVDGPFSSDLPEVQTDNLVLRALDRMRKEFNITAGAKVTLVKNIPSGFAPKPRPDTFDGEGFVVKTINGAVVVAGDLGE